MKEEARTTDIPIPQIYKKGMTDLKNDGIHFVTKLPDLKSVQTAMYTGRLRTNFKNVEQVTIPAQFLDFVLADYYYNNNRIVVFCSTENRKIMKDIDEFFIDGTFQSCPDPFTQLVSIHGDISKSASETHVIPLVYALMTNKSQESYMALFQMIKSEIRNWSPIKFHLDFEIATANALLAIFPEIKLKKCYYHLTKSIWKKSKELKMNSKHERRVVGLFTALALLPMDHMSNGIKYIKDESPNTSKIMLFEKYMRQTWLKNDEFILQWNVFGERHRTNNVIESWHSRLNKDMKKRLPKSILRLLNILVERENQESETTERRKEFIRQDDIIMNNQLQLVHGEITVGHFLEKLR
jgi:hypothetical protein